MFQLKWLWKYMGEKRWMFVVGLVLAAITSSILIINPMLSQKLIDEVITPQNTAMLIPILAIMMGVQLLRLSLRYLMVVCLETSSQTMMQKMRKHMFNVIQNEDNGFFTRIRTGDLMTRMTNDLDMLRHAMAFIAHNSVDSIVTFVAALTYLCTVNWQLTLSLLAITPFIIVVTRLFSKIISPRYVRLRRKLSDLNTVAQENIEGNRVVKAFAREEFEKEKFEEKNKDYRDYNYGTSVVGVKFSPILDLLSQSMTVITILVGGVLMINGQLSAGELMAFSSLTWALANPLRNLSTIINDLQRFFASCDMIIEIFYAQPSIVDRQNAIEKKERLKGKIEFQDVSLKLGNTEVLKHLNFTVEPGQTLGIMGSTGSGKTTLINMLARFYEATEGRVLVDDVDVCQYKLNDLRSSIGMAMQDVFLFSDTVDGNIAYGNPDLPFDSVVQYAKAADADSFIRRLEDGYDTIIGERGVGLSGGQRQRIALARALAVEPPILILDDPTSAVDMETEQYIQGQLKDLDFSCTKVIVSQKVSSVRDADQIIILDEGEIIEHGTHQELIEKKGYYYKIWALQNSVDIEQPDVGGDQHGAQ